MMKYKQYSQQFWQQLEASTKKACDTQPFVHAAFDADGTLWDTDLGEAFFQYLIDHQLVQLPADPWAYYEALKKKNNDPGEAYLWLAQILQGLPLETVRKWAEQSVKENSPLPIFDEQKKVIEYLLKNNVQVHIVTASVKWAVEPGAAFLGLKAQDVIGIETKVENGLVTDKLFGELTHHAGKPRALLQKTNQIKPFFCSGNTMGDFELLQSSTDLVLCVSAAARDDRLFKTENDLAKEGQRRGWHTHRFIEGAE